MSVPVLLAVIGDTNIGDIDLGDIDFGDIDFGYDNSEWVLTIHQE